jgi:hypothetical protein
MLDELIAIVSNDPDLTEYLDDWERMGQDESSAKPARAKMYRVSGRRR